MTEFKDDSSDLVKRLIRRDIQGMTAYQVPDSRGMIKLDAMENPYPWPGNLAGWQTLFNEVEVNRYPDPRGKRLVRQLRREMGIAKDYEVMLGNGSDEIIQLLIQAVASDDVQLVVPEPSFVMYRELARINRLACREVPLLPSFQLDVQAMLDAFREKPSSLVFLACPNNPTGISYSQGDIREIIQACPGLVVIDEAYIAFTDRNALPLLDEYPNVVVMRTLSKVGLAGLRLGMLIGDPNWIEQIDKIRLPYNINLLTQKAAEFALQNYHALLQQAAQIQQLRDGLIAELNTLPLDKIWPSDANFILVRTAEEQAKKIFQGLKEKGVLIKCLDGVNPLLRDCLRITVGTVEENARLLESLKELLKATS